ncbi:UNKNOWN [Stylonychia lemnae]|uniref:Elongin-C n=1 Tax=Stylonychia lemnae TaxID=5949 RepID=A0A078AP68_STYLE|nr:UNKNOWN [Stylonychia lemnae]|eukprot:CDW82758.1 UNKNOWN [Stylonychia lemnae]
MEQFLARQMDKSKGKPSIVNSSTIIKLISNDGHTFYVNKDVIAISKHLNNIVNSGFREGDSKEISLDINAEILEICVKYLHYKLIYRKVSFARPPFPIEPKIALDVLKAAIYLQC